MNTGMREKADQHAMALGPRAYELAMQKVSQPKIAETLNAEGFLSSSGQPLTYIIISVILKRYVRLMQLPYPYAPPPPKPKPAVKRNRGRPKATLKPSTEPKPEPPDDPVMTWLMENLWRLRLPINGQSAMVGRSRDNPDEMMIGMPDGQEVCGRPEVAYKLACDLPVPEPVYEPEPVATQSPEPPEALIVMGEPLPLEIFHPEEPVIETPARKPCGCKRSMSCLCAKRSAA